MKRIEIINMFRILGKVKLNKVEDRALRNALIADHLKMFRVAKENDEYIASLTGRFDPEAVDEVNEAYRAYADEKVDIKLERIDPDAFGDVLSKSDIDFTLGELSALGPLFTE